MEMAVSEAEGSKGTRGRRRQIPKCPPEKRSRIGKSRVTNGRRLLLAGGQNSKHFRRWRDLYSEYRAQISPIHDQLARQLATLVLQRELLDCEVVAGKPVDTLDLVRLANSIQRLLKQLDQLSKCNDDESRKREDQEALLHE